MVVVFSRVANNCENMLGVETLRGFVNQRLTAAAEEIFGVFERTIAEYEELLCRCKEENERKQKLLDDVQLRFHRADNQQLQVTQEEVPSERVEWSFSLDQDDSEPPYIKEEEEELWSSQERLDKAYTMKFPFAFVSVKTEDDEEKHWPSQLHEIQSEGMNTGADGEGCEGPEQARDSEPERHLYLETQDKTEDCYDGETDDSVKKSHSCPKCSKTFSRKYHLTEHMRTHQKDKPFSCSDCGNRFKYKSTLTKHMVIHTGKKPFSCSECDKTFYQKIHLTTHKLVHTGEKPISCSECDKKFFLKSQLITHMGIHTGKKPLSCSECDKSFYHKSHLNRHMLVHTGEKPFSCSKCDKKFVHKSQLTSHMFVHTREKPFSCELCHQKFSQFTEVEKHTCYSGQTL